ncbi:hypothetical protein [Phenylobacterium kunshanense]|uniref:Uncharacterized protein n=1 Tax=Phenylobacterium kunshanense TaxID=1445034 RepID=A0A328B6J2_9CAUL|nr:hypothetical protein [Phenylobacterium kunshanense]RAK63000.1 hypothetical protein DJ019_17135 [Phenylobacterium kunshanense]
MLLPIGPVTPEPLRGVLRSFHDALLALIAPAAPTPLFASTLAGLPAAAAHPHTLALVTDLNILAHSDGIHWIRQDTGAVIA